MASSGKQKTTMAKIMRERKMQERRMDKAVRKETRKREALIGRESGEVERFPLGEPHRGFLDDDVDETDSAA